MTTLTALECEDLPRRDVSFDLLRCKGGSREVGQPDLVNFEPGLVENSPRPLQHLLINNILASSLRSSDCSMNQPTGDSQLKKGSEISVDNRVGLEVGNISSGIWWIKRR